jgi:hypothetical protein
MSLEIEQRMEKKESILDAIRRLYSYSIAAVIEFNLIIYV